MKLSIILPTFNRLAQLKKVIEGLECQTIDIDSFDVIIISDGSLDGTDEYLRKLNTPLQVTPLFQDNQGAAAARNKGVSHATGDLILFLDDDVVPTKRLIAEHVESHRLEGDNVVVLGPMLTPSDFEMAPWVRWEQAMLDKQYDAMSSGLWQPTARQFYTGNASIARVHLSGSQPFDTEFRRAEDVELAYRLADQGIRFVFNPDAIGYHYAKRSFESWSQTPYSYGRNDVLFSQVKGQNWLLPLIMNEYRDRNILIKLIATLGISHKQMSKVIVTVLRLLAYLGTLFSIQSLPRLAYSGIFNLYHYQGIADGLGGRNAFFDLVASDLSQDIDYKSYYYAEAEH